MPILVTGTIDIDPAHRGAFIAACQQLMDGTRQEQGCEHYSFAADLADPGRFHVSEQWTSADDMAAHTAAEPLTSFMGKLGDLGVRGASLTKWDGATGSRLM